VVRRNIRSKAWLKGMCTKSSVYWVVSHGLSGSWVTTNERLSAVMANFAEVHTTIQKPTTYMQFVMLFEAAE